MASAPATTATPAPAPALPPISQAPASGAPATPKDKPADKAVAAPSVRATGGDYWVQVASFKQSDQASRLATKLRDQNFAVVETTATIRTGPAAPKAAPSEPQPSAPAGESRYDVFVTGTGPDEVTPKLPTNEVTAEASGDGSVIKPSLPLQEAVALSKSLATAGLKVQVRRVRVGEPAAPSGASESAGTEAASVYRVRVGPFPDHPTAVAAMHELEARGYKPFIAKAKP
jgi:cell division protein FtsN